MTGQRANPFLGQWRIVWMELWDQDFIDMEVPGHFTFEKEGLGNFQFGLVQDEMDCRFEGNRVEFSWFGNGEMEEASGRGWARIEHGELIGRILFHRGDESEFRAVKA